jgi:UDP:flavonoid glycosyltransferase YjiC (YdhE family)
MAYKNVIVMSPPFYSHFSPMLALGLAFLASGARVTMACSQEFRAAILEAGLEFAEVVINNNANPGSAEKAQQIQAEHERLEEFIQATYLGAVATLLAQARHRKADMLANPEELIDRIQLLQQTIEPDLWIVDQLSYGVTLALVALGLPFISFCPPHPSSIPDAAGHFGVPLHWPSGFAVSPAQQHELVSMSRQIEWLFSERWNEVIKAKRLQMLPVREPFHITSSRVVVFNYPDFYGQETRPGTPARIFIGSSFIPEPLDELWQKRLASAPRPIILVVLGTFLACRADVLKKIIKGIRTAYNEASIIVGAGPSADSLADLQGRHVWIEKFVPQKALLPQVDLVVHHGGVSSFTETLYYAKPALILPFSSDQFAVAHDAEVCGVARILNPNTAQAEDVSREIRSLLIGGCQQKFTRWSAYLQERGPAYGVARIQKENTGQTPRTRTGF